MRSPTPRSASNAPPQPKEAEAQLSRQLWLRRAIVFLSIAVAGCAADLVTKSLVFHKLGNSHVVRADNEGTPPAKVSDYWLIDRVFGFQTSLNEGALFGLGQGQVTLFAALSIVALAGIVYWLFVAGAAHDRLLTIALGCVTGGILGNLYDRLGLAGLRWTPQGAIQRGHEIGGTVYAVRDWLLFQIDTDATDAVEFTWPNFNIADSLLVCGAFLLIWHAMFSRGPISAETTDNSGKD